MEISLASLISRTIISNSFISAEPIAIGTIWKISDKKIEIMMDKAASQEELSGSLKLVMMINNVTYKRCVNAMTQITKSE